MAKEVRSELQWCSGRGSEWQEKRGDGDKATGRHCFENPASTLTCAACMGRKSGFSNDILQRNQTIHPLLKSPLVSNNKTIFTGGLWAVGHITMHTDSMLQM